MIGFRSSVAFIVWMRQLQLGQRVTRKLDVGASQLSNWRKLECEGALTAMTAGESVVPASEPARVSRIRRYRSIRVVDG